MNALCLCQHWPDHGMARLQSTARAVFHNARFTSFPSGNSSTVMGAQFRPQGAGKLPESGPLPAV
ncbi:hypothetical protein SCLCIDRAFT_1208930 [Scleroderma citrinum Foug A]|uniref:Uncharacterized protein n=1 Tax=Scleroderma citrinum Foug A TaxID=1036808 RepID=A0A0C3ELG2_9AGAM|nr:hypothetical protein SCLCIDRAFT_1208930 [Scleroderma citrinum Foug A]